MLTGVATGAVDGGGREEISCGSAVFSSNMSAEAPPASSLVPISGSISSSVLECLFMPSFALNLLRTRRFDPALELTVDAREEDAEEELVESNRARKPGADSSSIRCCGVP